MKTLRMIGMALFAVLMCVNFASCSSEEDVEPNEPQKPKEYTVSLGFTGEISVSEAPLSRAEGNDLYGVYVYSCPNSGENNKYKQYAIGLFDDPTAISIKLQEGYKYKFVSTMIVNGKQSVFSTTNSDSELIWSSPFNLPLNNDFNFSSSFGDSHEKGYSYVNGHTYYVPNVDRYYGEFSDYIPSENGKVDISMKRTSFGIKVVADKLEEGTLNIAINGGPGLSIEHPKTAVEDIYTFQSVVSAYNTEDYSETIATTISWTKEDGAIVPLGTHNITYKRNKLTTITIKVADKTSENGIGITIDDEEKNLGEGDNFTVENGEIIDTNVNTGTEG